MDHFIYLIFSNDFNFLSNQKMCNVSIFFHVWFLLYFYNVFFCIYGQKSKTPIPIVTEGK